jgi:uncharacterized protein (TIGR03437 family)
MYGRARLILLVLLPSAAYSQSLFPSGLARFAGKDNSAYTGDNGPAYYGKFRTPAALARDAAGNLYIAEAARLRKIDTRGIITTLTTANNPGGIAVDSRGTLYFTENQSAIRRLAPDGTLTTFVSAAGVAPQGLAIDARDQLYFTDVSGRRVRMLKADGSTAIVAGTGSAGTGGEGGPATAADLTVPWQLAFDAAGNLYVADSLRLLKIDPRGRLTKIADVTVNGVAVDAAGIVYAASTGLSKITPDGVVHSVTATAAGCSAPTTVVANSVLLDPAGNLYVLTFALLQQISPDGKLTTLAGAGPNLFTGDGGPAANATFASPAGIAFDRAGRLYVADSGNNRVRAIDSNGTVRTIAGDGAPTYDQDAACLADNDTFLRNPQAVAVDSAGSVYIADTGKNRIRKIAADGAQSTFASGLQQPIGIAVDAAGNVYVGEKGKRVLRIDSKGAATAVATARVSGTLAVDAAGGVLISATYEIDRLRPDGMLVPVAGTGQPAQTVAGRFQETIVNAAGVTIDSAGNIFVADSGKPAIQRTSTACAIAADNPPQLEAPSGIAFDSAGNLYIADSRAGTIWKAAAFPPPAGEAPTPHIAISPVRSAAPALVPPPPFEPNHFGPTVAAQEAVAPGELIRISGACIGPFDPVAATFDASGRLPNSLGDVQVAISGFAVTLISVSAGDIVAVVPYGLDGVSGADILLGLRYRGVLDQNTITVQPVNPALFTTNLTTDGPAVALNQDGSLNSASQPASLGSVISLWATGTGQTLPSSVDGQAAPVGTLLRVKLPVTVSIGGQDAEIQFAGAAPGFAGLTQINVRVPANAAPGSALVKMTVGGTPLNQGSIMIWVSQ